MPPSKPEPTTNQPTVDNWKEKEADLICTRPDRAFPRRVTVRIIGCTCSACNYSEELPACKINHREPEITHMCWKHDERVKANQTPCDDFR